MTAASDVAAANDLQQLIVEWLAFAEVGIQVDARCCINCHSFEPSYL
jgi:hypothetical protein